MVLFTAAIIVCLSLAVRRSDGSCQVGDITYAVGDVWSAEGSCTGFTCLENGTTSAKKCEPIPEDLPKGWTIAPGPLNFPFPGCCEHAIEPMYDYSLPGCTVDNKTVKVGEQYDLPGRCDANICKGNDEWAVGACGLTGAFPGDVLLDVDTSKPFPQCCGRAVSGEGIVPDVVDNLNMPQLLNITYGEIDVEPGKELTPTQVKGQPAVHYTADPEAWYLLCMTDPDAPSRNAPDKREFKHWLVGNIPGNNVTEGEVLADYVGSGPPKGTGPHRYVFLLYKQPSKLNFEEPRVNNTSIGDRRTFAIRKYAQEKNLGDPVAFNVYKAQYDDFVPTLHSQLGIKV